jgi:hypothetical protein
MKRHCYLLVKNLRGILATEQKFLKQMTMSGLITMKVLSKIRSTQSTFHGDKFYPYHFFSKQITTHHLDF